MQAEIRGLSPFSNSANLSHLGFCENTACESHYCSCIGALDSVILGPIVAFSANSGSTICNEAPLWRFLPASFAARFRWASDWVSAECFCEGLWPGFGSGRACEGLLQGIPWSLSHDLLRRLAIDVPQRNLVFAFGLGYRSATKISCLRLGRASFCNENFALAFGAGHRLATNPRVCCRVNNHPVRNDGVSRSRPRRSAVSGVE